MCDIQSMYGLQSIYDVRSMNEMPHVGADSDRMKHRLGEGSDRKKNCMGEPSDRMMNLFTLKSSFLQAHVGKTCIIINKTIHQWMIDV